MRALTLALALCLASTATFADKADKERADIQKRGWSGGSAQALPPPGLSGGGQMERARGAYFGAPSTLIATASV
jgi:hypothetical protein